MSKKKTIQEDRLADARATATFAFARVLIAHRPVDDGKIEHVAAALAAAIEEPGKLWAFDFIVRHATVKR